jgi:hypothetical protein
MIVFEDEKKGEDHDEGRKEGERRRKKKIIGAKPPELTLLEPLTHQFVNSLALYDITVQCLRL